MKASKKTPSKQTKQTKQKTATDVLWFVFYGFKKSSRETTGFLSLLKEGKKVYLIVDSKQDATLFPSKNVSKVKGFGTPAKWLHFFETEQELKDWSFHLVNVKPRQRKVNKPSRI